MDLKQLRLFRGVVDAGSFTKAAEFLYIAQPALGLQIQNLERELGVQLLLRHSRGVTPTEAGELLYRHAEILLRQFEQVRQDMIDFASEPHGRVCLGMTPTATLAIASELVEACRSSCPGVVLTLVEGLGEQLIPWVETDRINIALTYNQVRSKSLHLEHLADETLYLISPASYGETGKTIKFKDALALDMVLTTGMHGLRAMIEDAARKHETALRIVCEANSVLAIKDLVCRGFGHTILPLGAVRAEIKAGTVVARKLMDPELVRALFLAVATRQPVSKATDVVCREIQNAVARLAADGTVGWKAVAVTEQAAE
jgi:LysR family nitrogen assimilation transcriptional regulator